MITRQMAERYHIKKVTAKNFAERNELRGWMNMKKKMRKKQIINYFRFVAVGILFLLIVAFVSGCGSQTQDNSSSSEQKKVTGKHIEFRENDRDGKILDL